MPNQKQFDTTLQSIRNIDCKLFVLDYDYTVLDEISGKTESVSLSVDAESDIRRTANINIALKDDSRQTNSNIFYWQVGNPYWFDKYIQIYVAIQDVQSQEFVWVNEGIYMVNSPTISYDATTNNLSFEAVDLMSKMTGLRNGQLEGMTYTIPVGSTITGALKTLLVEQGFDKYIIFDPPYNYVPQEIKIDIGGTAYDLLCELRDINANWEMFFDVDGVFHFQQIPSGKVIVDPIIDEEGEPTPVVDQTILDSETDLFNRILVSSKMKMAAMKTHPFITQFMASVWEEASPEVNDLLASLKMEAGNFRNEMVLREDDSLKFKNPEDAQPVYNMLLVMAEGYAARYRNAAVFDFETVMNEFEKTISILKNNFYKEEYLK